MAEDREELVRRHEAPLRRTLRARLRHEPGFGESDVDNVLQQTWLKLLEEDSRRLRAYDPARPILPFLLGVAMNACRDYLKKERLRRGNAGGEALDWLEAPHKDEADLEALRKALAGLPPRDRLLMTWVDRDGLSHARAARLLGLAPGSIGTLIARAHARLRELLEKSEIPVKRRPDRS